MKSLLRWQKVRNYILDQELSGSESEGADEWSSLAPFLPLRFPHSLWWTMPTPSLTKVILQSCFLTENKGRQSISLVC